MALIQCPECGKQVSHQAIICPNCGYKVMNYVNQLRIEHSITTLKCKSKKAVKRFLKPALTAIIASGAVFLIVALASLFYDIYLRLQPEPEPDIFEYVSSNKYEPFALTAENNIIGKDISVVLNGLFEGKDYRLESDSDSHSYTFYEQIDYPRGENAELTIHAGINNNLVHMIEYSFSTDINSSHLSITRLCEKLTTYCDASPSYTYMNDEGFLEDFPEDNFTLYMANNKNIYYIIWEAGDLVVSLYVPNITDSNTVTCSVLFFNTDILEDNRSIIFLKGNNNRSITTL